MKKLKSVDFSRFLPSQYKDEVCVRNVIVNFGWRRCRHSHIGGQVPSNLFPGPPSSLVVYPASGASSAFSRGGKPGARKPACWLFRRERPAVQTIPGFSLSPHRVL